MRPEGSRLALWIVLAISVAALVAACKSDVDVNSESSGSGGGSSGGTTSSFSVAFNCPPGEIFSVVDGVESCVMATEVDVDGDGTADGLDLDGDGIIDMFYVGGASPSSVSTISASASFTAVPAAAVAKTIPVDIDGDGIADLYLFVDVDGRLSINTAASGDGSIRSCIA